MLEREYYQCVDLAFLIAVCFIDLSIDILTWSVNDAALTIGPSKYSELVLV